MRKEIEKPYTILGDVKVTEEMLLWFILLTQGNEDKVREFAILNDECSTTPMAILKYRRQMLDKQSKDLKIDAEGSDEIAEQLETMFLEPIWPRYARLIKRVMKKNGWTWDDVVQEHYKDIEKRIWRIVSCKNSKYIA